MIIGITGGIGSGKSTIARALAARGYAVYDCDKEAKRIIAENHDVQQQIINLFGEKSFINGIYNTQYISKCVFSPSLQGRSGEALLAQLNAIVHPAVKEDICQQALPAVCQQSGLSAKRSVSKAVLFIESAILYEAGLDAICDKIFVIEAPEDIRIARTIARDYHGDASPENIDKVRARIRAQQSSSPLHGGTERGFSLINDGRKSIDELAEEIIALLH